MNKLINLKAAAAAAIMALASALTLLVPQPALAASLGPNSGSTFVNDNSIGSHDWINPGNAATSDDSRAQVSLDSGGGASNESHYLKSTGFGFSIPTTATINGIVVNVEKSTTDTTRIGDNSIRLVKGGTIVGDDKASSATWPSPEATVSYGGATDLWGSTFTPTDINSSNFGVVFSAKHIDGSGSRTAYIDHISISVYYTVPDTTAPTGSLNINSGATFTNNTSVTLNLSATDAVGVTGYRVTNGTNASGATPVSVTSTNVYSASVPFTLSPTTDGSHIVAVQYRDAAGNWSTNYTASITLDTVAPTIAITPGDTTTPHKSATWNWSANESSTYRYLISTDPSAMPYGSFSSDTSVTQSTGNGTYYLKVEAKDTAGNSTVRGVYATLDNTAPVIASASDVVSTATALGGTNVSYTLPTATDNHDSTVTVTCGPVSGSFFSLGQTTVTCNASDAAGNAATPVTFKVTVNPGPVNAGQSTVTVSTPTATTDGGTSTVIVHAKDVYGNPISGIPAGSVVISALPTTGNTITQPVTATDGTGMTSGDLKSTKAGVKTVTVTVNGEELADHPTVTFNHGALSTIVVSPTGPQSVTTGGTIGFSAQGVDGNNNPIPALTYIWAVVPVSGDTGTVNGSGLFTSDHPGTAKVTATSGAITGESGTITINKLDQTITFGTLSNKTYGDADFTVSATASSGLPVSFGASGACSVAGSTVSITAAGTCTITADQVGNDYYNAAPSVPQSFTVDTRAITVTADAKSKVYGETDPALTYQLTAGSLVGTDVLSGSLARAAGENVGDRAITQGTVTAGANYIITYVGASLTITKKPITVTAVTDTKVYDGNTSSAGVPTVLPGLAFTDTPGFTQTFDNKNVGSGKVLTPAGVVNDGNSGNNYDVTFVTVSTGTITPLGITVTANTQTKVYGAADPTLTYGVSPDLMTGDSFTGALSRTSGENVGTYAINQGTLSAGANYSITYVAADLTITERAVTVKADATSKTYGDPDPTLTYQVTSGSLVAGDVFTGALERTPGELVGTYPISQGALVLNSNYILTFVGNDFTINKKAASVTPDDKSKVYGDPDPELTGTLTGFLPSDSVVAAYSRTGLEDIGTYVISATLSPAGVLGNYSITYNTANFEITKKKVTVTATASNKVYDGAATASVTLDVTGEAGSDVLGASVGTASFDNKNVGTGKTVTVSGITLTGVNASNYDYDATVTTTADITKLGLTVTAAADTKVYNGNTLSSGVPAITTGALVGGDTAAWTQTFDNKNVGTGKILTPAGVISDGNSGNNYDVTYVTNTSGVITPRALTVSATGNNKVYDSTKDATVTLSSDKETGDSLTLLYTKAEFSDANVGAGKTVAVSGITVTGPDAGNYSANTDTTTTADITKRSVTVTADAKSKTYGETDPALTYHITSGTLVGVDGFSGALTRVAGENAGTYPIEVGTLTLGSNYDLTFVSADFVINKATPVITWPTPPDMTAGTALSSTQLNATTPVAGSFSYNPDFGTVITLAGPHKLKTDFTPTDTANYNTASAEVTLTVVPAATTKVTVSASPSTLTTAQTSTLTVNGRDQYDNITTNQSGTVVAIGVDNGGALGATIVTLASGAATTSLNKTIPGDVHVTVTSGILTPGNTTVTFTKADTDGPIIDTDGVHPAGTGIAISAPLFFTVNEPLALASVSSANVQLWKRGHDAIVDNPATTDVDETAPAVADSQVSATVSLVEGGKRVNITPASPLEYNASYFFVITTGVTDEASNALQNPKDKTNTGFTTVADTADHTAPTITAHSPSEPANTNVSISVTPSVTFSEALDSTTVNSASVELLNGSTPVAATVSLTDGGTRVIITPASPLNYSTAYHFTVSTAVTDVAGNALAAGGDYSFTTEAEPVANIAITQTELLQSYATPDNDFAHGWKWKLKVTAPSDEHYLRMKFTDFTSGSNTVPAAGNIQFYSAQSSDHASSGAAMGITAANTFSSDITLSSDLDPATPGRQIEIIIEVKVPAGTPGGSYSNSYDIQTSTSSHSAT